MECAITDTWRMENKKCICKVCFGGRKAVPLTSGNNKMSKKRQLDDTTTHSSSGAKRSREH
ncbi:hypothetical protein EV356DRAFT_509921 [Viridothelium virens]|uniref:Uncharacterized protein n=1 Tax=Viridothelium virens TaxID=1048519 RepID=A0A6A6GW79_VIRVR|nr:hypothetical protein EV356DRAFT_509921 [Viridothelium virens]